MHGKGHIAAGLITGIVSSCFLFANPFEPVSIGVFTAASLLGGLTPDIDMPTSTIGKPLKPISKLINKLFGHRTITHAVFWIIPIVFLIWRFSGFEGVRYHFLTVALQGYLCGFLSHLLGDMMTTGGIPLLYPLKTKRYKTFKNKAGVADNIVVVYICIIWIVCCAGWHFKELII